MRILIFSWEYPPYIVGGLGQHVAELLPALGNLPGLELHLVIPRWAGGQPVERLGSVTIHRVYSNLLPRAISTLQPGRLTCGWRSTASRYGQRLVRST